MYEYKQGKAELKELPFNWALFCPMKICNSFCFY